MQLTSIKENQAFFTVVTKSYLAFARAMAGQLKKFHPDIPLVVFLADNPDGCFDPIKEPFPVVELRDYLPGPLLETMPAYYTAFEFCNALKGFAHLHLASKPGLNCWLYLDADIFVCGSFDRIFSTINEYSILLTPHILHPASLAKTERIERAFLKHGIYNGGCVGIRNTPIAREFLAWWTERLTWLCLLNLPGLSCDQTWLNFVPLFFKDVHILRDPAVNVAYWNLHERPLVLASAESATVAGKSVPFLHLSGWDWQQPEVISRHLSGEAEISQPVWRQLTRRFAEILIFAGIKESSIWPYSFAKARDGTVITPGMRRRYWDVLRNKTAEQIVPSLFANPEIYAVEPVPQISLRQATRTLLRGIQQRFFK